MLMSLIGMLMLFFILMLMTDDYPLWGRSIATTWKMLMRLIVTLIIFVGVAVVLQEESQIPGRC